MRKSDIKAVNQLGGVFPNEEVFQEIYSECLENQPQASEAVRNSSRGRMEAGEDCRGYKAAVAAFVKGGAA